MTNKNQIKLDGENINTFVPRMGYLILKTSTRSRAKEIGTQYKNKAKTTQIVHAPFTCYQSIQKKISDLNSIHKSTTLTCQHISLFWEVEKRAGKLDKNISPMPSIVHAHFTCYEYVLKKFTALNYTNKRMTLACQLRALLPDSE